LFSVIDFDGLTPPHEMIFNEESFLVRMYNMPLACMDREMGVKLGSNAGTIEEVDTNEEGIRWGEYLRVRIRINIQKPLVRGKMIKVRNKAVLIPFKYEKIPKFCYQCGVINHGDQGCLKKDVRRHRGRSPRCNMGRGFVPHRPSGGMIEDGGILMSRSREVGNTKEGTSLAGRSGGTISMKIRRRGKGR
jgi:hypothetical protein